MKNSLQRLLLTIFTVLALAASALGAPAITTQPASTNWTLGQTGTLTVAATGTGPLSYQWRKFGTPIDGATSATLTVSNVGLAAAGLYNVTVTDSSGTLLSAAAQINPAPAMYPNAVRPRVGFNPRFEGVGSAEMIVPIPGGGFYAGGSFTRIGNTACNGIARFLASGALDPSFGAPSISGGIRAAALQADGRIIVAGNFLSIGGVSRSGIARLNPDGTLDSTFTVGTGFDSGCSSVIIQTDGKIIVGGYFMHYNGAFCPYIARLNTDGSQDTSYGGGSRLGGAVYALALQGDGKVVVGGLFSGFGTAAVKHVARLNTDGSPDIAFATAAGTGFNNDVSALAVDSSGRIIVGGNFDTYNSVSRNFLARLNPDGSLDAGFLPTNDGPTSNVTALSIDPAGRILVGGAFYTYAGVARPCVTRVSPVDGSPDATFMAGQPVASPVMALGILADGKIVIGGSFDQVGGAVHEGIARLGANGSVDNGFTAGLRGPGIVNVVLPLANGQWLVGGEFIYVNEVSAKSIARLNADGSIDAAYGASISLTGSRVPASVGALLAQPDGKVYVGGLFSTVNNVAGRNNLVRLAADGTYDPTFVTGAGPNGQVAALALQVDGKLLVGVGFTSYKDVTYLSRLNPDGSADSGFITGAGFDRGVNALRVQPDGKILVGGAFANYAGSSVGRLVRLNADGSKDADFLSAPAGSSFPVRTIVPLTDGHIWVGGGFTGGLLLRNTDGTPDSSYAPSSGLGGSYPYADSVLPQSDGKVVVHGYFTTFNDSAHNAFVRVNPDGTADPSFSLPAFLSYSYVSLYTPGRLNYLTDGSILVNGSRFDFAEGFYAGLLILEDTRTPVIVTQPIAKDASGGTTVTLSVTATGEDLIYQWFKGGVPVASAAGASLVFTNVKVADAGSYSVTISTPSGFATTSTAAVLTVNAAPIITTAPVSATVIAGNDVTFTVAATGNPAPIYQWKKDGAIIAGATGTSLFLPEVSTAAAGSYAVDVTNRLGTVTSAAAVLTVNRPSHLANLSTRAAVGTGDNALIVGFVIRGSDPKPVLIRGVGGATLALRNVSGPLPDPVLDLYHGSPVIGHNDNWGTAGNPADITAVADRVGAFALPGGSVDSALSMTLQPGIYSAILYGSGTANTGVGLLEIYDAQDGLTASSPRLVNLSSRGQVGTGDQLMIAGFVITGDQARTVLIRGVGPALVGQGMAANLVLTDPAIYLYKGPDVIGTNDNWGSAGDSAALTDAAVATGAFPLPAGSKDAAMLMTLQPGAYSVLVAGTGGTTGIALVELYEVE